MCLTLAWMPGAFCQAGLGSGSSPTSCHAHSPTEHHGRECAGKTSTQDWKALEQPVHPCKDNSTPLDTSSIPKHNKDSHKHTVFLIQHSKRGEKHGIRSTSLNNICKPTEVAWTFFIQRILSDILKNIKILTKTINDKLFPNMPYFCKRRDN